MGYFPNTPEIWEIDTKVNTFRFIEALDTILGVGDVLVFAAYEPTPEMSQHLVATGAIRRGNVSGLYDSFDLNREEHPDGCAFELPLASDTLTSLLRAEPGVLRQRDKDPFFDHVVAYRPTTPKTPLIHFHAAFNGGTLVLSGIFDEHTARLFSSKIEGTITGTKNPHYYEDSEEGQSGPGE